MAEPLFWLTTVERETHPLIDLAGLRLKIGGPQHDSRITGTSREAEALVDQPGADPGAAGVRFNQQQTQLGGVGVARRGAEDGADAFAADLGDPRGFARRCRTRSPKSATTRGDERLEGGIPPVSAAYRAPCRSTTQPRSPGSGDAARGRPHACCRRASAGSGSIAATSCVALPSSSGPPAGRSHPPAACRAPANARCPASVRRTSWRRASVVDGSPLDESVGDEPGQDPAQIAGVQIERPPQFRICQSVRRAPVRTARGPRSARMREPASFGPSRPRMRV